MSDFLRSPLLKFSIIVDVILLACKLLAKAGKAVLSKLFGFVVKAIASVVQVFEKGFTADNWLLEADQLAAKLVSPLSKIGELLMPALAAEAVILVLLLISIFLKKRKHAAIVNQTNQQVQQEYQQIQGMQQDYRQGVSRDMNNF